MTQEGRTKQQLEKDVENFQFQSELLLCKEEVQTEIDKWLNIHSNEEMARYDRICDQLNDLKKQLSTIERLFEQGKGALTILRYLGYGVMGLWGLTVWFKDHIKF